jgi:uncharacterized lipoprotein
MKYLTIILCITSLFTLTACNTIHNRNNEYLTAKNDPALKLPEGVNGSKLEQSYPIPKGDSSHATPVDMLPPGLKEDEAAAVAAQ